MDAKDRADLIFEVSEPMNEAYEDGYSAEEVRRAVIGFARGWRDD